MVNCLPRYLILRNDNFIREISRDSCAPSPNQAMQRTAPPLCVYTFHDYFPSPVARARLPARSLILFSLGVMPFPVSAHGKVSVYGADMTRAMTTVEAVIRRGEPRSISIGEDHVEFVAVLAFGLSISPISDPADSGAVAFRQADGWLEVRYRLSFVHMLRDVTAIVFLVFLVLPLLLLGFSEVPSMLLLASIVWLVLFGANYLFTASRFRAAMFRAATGARPNAVRDATLHA